MRSGRGAGAQHMPGRGARARAERLWRETVASSPAAGEGGAETQAPSACSPSPPRGEERAGARWGRRKASASQQSLNGVKNGPSLPSGSATRKLRALWISAFHLGLVRDSSDAALAAWLRRQTGRDGGHADAGHAGLTPDGIAHAIQPLEAWLARAAGVDWRPHLSLGRSGHVREVRRPRARVLEAQWRILYRQGRVRIASHAALGAYASRFAGLGRADSHLALSDAQADALIRHLGTCIRKAGAARENALGRRRAQAAGRGDPSAATSG